MLSFELISLALASLTAAQFVPPYNDALAVIYTEDKFMGFNKSFPRPGGNCTTLIAPWKDNIHSIQVSNNALCLFFSGGNCTGPESLFDLSKVSVNISQIGSVQCGEAVVL